MDIYTECFFSLSHTLNFSETARQLYISQQAVSKNIAKLEKKIGFPLFYRSSHGVELTTWGEAYLEANTLFIDTCDQIRQNYNQDNHTLRISAIDQPDFQIIKSLRTFTPPGSDAPYHISILYDTPNTGPSRLLGREADFLVTIDRFITEFPGLKIVPVFDLQAALIVSRSHPKYHEHAKFSDFRDEPLIMGVDSDDHFATRESILEDIRIFGLKPSSIVLLSNSKQAMAALSQGNGIVLGSVITVSPDDKELAVIPSDIWNQIICVWDGKLENPVAPFLANHIKELYHKTYSSKN